MCDYEFLHCIHKKKLYGENSDLMRMIILTAHISWIQFSSPNVCTSRDESTEGSDVSSNKESSGEAEELSSTGIQDSSFIHHFSLNVESCQETTTKHICKRV